MIREATPEDLGFMLSLGEEMFNESRYSDKFIFEPIRVALMMLSHMNDPNGIVFVTDHGMLIAAVEEHWFSTGLRSDDRVIYVSKEHRHGREGLELIRAYEEKAKELGAIEIHIGSGTGIDTDRVERLFDRLGYDRMGGYYVKAV